jgi:hypothetical protein
VGEFDGSAIQLELKYRERCSGLWLRPKGSDLVFCALRSRHVWGEDQFLLSRAGEFRNPPFRSNTDRLLERGR